MPLLTEVEAEVFPMERYQDVMRRYGVSKQNSQWKEGITGNRRVAVDSPDQLPISVPWNIQGPEYQTLKKACFDPSVRLANTEDF